MLGCSLHTQRRTAEGDFGISGLEGPACDKVSTLPLTVTPACQVSYAAVMLPVVLGATLTVNVTPV